jgi:hypothetical protein
MIRSYCHWVWVLEIELMRAADQVERSWRLNLWLLKI